MAEAFNVAGPTKIQVKHDPAGGFVDFGHTDNTDLVSFESFDSIHKCFSNDTGDAPAELVYNGATGMIFMTLGKWDEAVYAAMMHRLRKGASGTTEGGYTPANDIGELMIGGASVRVVQIKILTTTPGQKSYTFGRCWIDGNGARQLELGNREKKLALAINVTPDANGDLYTPATNA